MAAEIPSPPFVASINCNDRTVSPGPHDVLLGRGCGASDFPGNQHFRALIEQRKEEYTANSRFEPKKRIAKEIIHQIHTLGGRFLKLVESDGQMLSIVEEGKWEVVEEKVALEKIKQALREKKTSLDKSQVSVEESPCEKEADGYAKVPQDGSLQTHEGSNQVLPVISQPSISPFMFPFGVGGLSSIDPHLLLFHTHVALAQAQAHVLPLPVDRFQNFPAQPSDAAAQVLIPSNEDPVFHNHVQPRRHTAPSASLGRELTSKNGMAAVVRNAAPCSESSSSDDEDALLALSALSVADRPRFSAQEEARERASLTDEEKAEILADTFGKNCVIGVGPRQKKKARKDLDTDSIKFLVNYMRGEIEKVPVEKKQALLEAQEKCDAEEFSDARLERFLRCVGMNVKSAAQRFVNYWEARREVFGPEKYLQRMTLSEALRDDLVAIEAGVYCQLPLLDSSGRQLLWMEPRRHTRQGYTSASLLRAYWYLIEVASKENKDVGSGCVTIVWDRHSSLYDFDRYVGEAITRFENESWPIKIIAHHVCCPTRFNMAIMKPIFFAKASRETRARTLFHDVPPGEITETLSDYGIYTNMLPLEMGGALNFKQSEWIAQRRATEMEEI